MREILEQYGEMLIEILGTGVVVGILTLWIGMGGSFQVFVIRLAQMAC